MINTLKLTALISLFYYCYYCVNSIQDDAGVKDLAGSSYITSVFFRLAEDKKLKTIFQYIKE